MSAVLYDVLGPRARRRALIGTVIGTLVVLAVLGLVGWQFQRTGQFAKDQWAPFTDPGVQRLLLKAIVSTVKAAATAILLSLLLGIVLAAGRLSDHAVLRIPTVAFVEFFRAIPLLLMILFLFLGFADRLGTFGSLVLALTLYNGSVLSEIFRAGIVAVARGQSEAAYSLGLRKSQVMLIVLVPQAVRIMLPAIVSQCVVALKDTALGFVISYEELLRQGKLIYDNFGNIVPTVIVVAAIYIAMNSALSALAGYLQRRTSRKARSSAAVVTTVVAPPGRDVV
ncbi:MAG: amino acid ABC transporter permease [Pseudonocardiales bacterium]|nr:MAG: amino acid ABC transporter permease [Pseudonocardiales bacterium]